MPSACALIRCVTFSVLTLLSVRPVLADEESDRSSRLAASLIDGALHNNRSLSSFDVLIKMEKMVMPPNGHVSVVNTTSRYMQDDNGRQLIAHWKVFDKLNKDEAKNTQATLTAFFYENEKNRIVFFNDFGKRTMPTDSLDRFRDISLAPRFSTVGFVGFPHRHSRLTEKDPYWESITIPSEHTTAKNISDQSASVSSIVIKNGEEVRRTEWTFDLIIMMPTQRKTFYTHSVTGKRLPEQSEQYQWENKSGVNVPIKIRREVRQIAKDEETGRQVPYSEFYDTTLVWNMANESQGEIGSLLSSLNSPQAIRDWIREGEEFAK